ncbi:MAG: hypothetical protein Q4F63_06315 [Clostridia bacterium]|nr:hypothetical protein [Clostridia bacterium]
MAYSRVFVALKQGCQDYAKDVRGSVGRCVIELRNGAGRLILQAQGLKSDCDYRVCVLTADSYAEASKPLYVDGTGKGELKWEFSPKNIGVEVADIKSVAVLVKDKAPLIGFVDGEYNWQSCLMAKDTTNNIKKSNAEIKAVEAAAAADVINSEKENSREDENFREETSEKEKLIYIINEFDRDIDEIKKYSKIGTADGENYIFSKEPQTPFGNDEVIWVKTGLKELCLVKAFWKYINNPFVIKGCKDYKHLLVGKSENNYYLAVPGKYDRAYKLEAMAQGFNECRAYENKPVEQGEPCYYVLKC